MASVVLDEFVKLRGEWKRPASQLVFERKFGGKTATRSSWVTAFMALEDIAIENYTWHNNRHTFCSWLAMAGTPRKTIQELAGHRALSMTARYSHRSPDHKSSEIEKLVTAASRRC